MALTHEKVGHTGQGLWHSKGRQLPAYIQHIANDLMQQRGMGESAAIATAVAVCKKWAAGGGDVKPETRAKAAAAVAEWERLKASTKVKRSEPVDHDSDGTGASPKRKTSSGVSRGLVTRTCPLEDIHIVSRADGDGTGRVVEAYAAVFDQPVNIRDGQGHYEEIIHRGAFDRTLEHLRRSPGGLSRVKVLYNHGKGLDGASAPEYQRPLATPLEIKPEGRGLLTRSEYKKTPLAEEILDDIKAGRLTGQSFEGPDLQSDPPLRGPGDKYRRRAGVLPRVTRMVLGLLNYGPALYEAYPGAEFLGVRMAVIGDDDGDFTGDEDEDPGMDGELTGVTPGEVIPSRSHAHRLWQIHYEEMARQAGIITGE